MECEHLDSMEGEGGPRASAHIIDERPHSLLLARFQRDGTFDKNKVRKMKTGFDGILHHGNVMSLTIIIF